jgi:hypothetical protein
VGVPARWFADGATKASLTPVLVAWGLEVPATKAEMVEALSAVFADPARVAAQAARLTAEHRATLTSYVDDDSPGYDLERYNRRVDALTAGRALGLVFPTYAEYAGDLPAEVRIALRDRAFPFSPVEPPPALTAASEEMVAREGAAALSQFNEASMAVLDQLRDTPAKWLKNGGIGAREISRVAKAAKVEVPMVRLVLECAYAAGILQWYGPLVKWGPTAATWRDLDPGARVTLLLEAWLGLCWPATRTHDLAAKALPVADEARRCDRCRAGRRAVLEAWAGMPVGRGVDDASLAGVVAWRRPLLHTEHREVVVRVEPDRYPSAYRRGRGRGAWSTRAVADPIVLPGGAPTLGTFADEARMVGLVAHGAATPLLRALLAGEREQVVALAEGMLPATTGVASFGSDLTVVVPGTASGGLSRLLDSCADREGRGGATTWRFTTVSVRRALDEGVSARELLAQLEEVAGGALPQPLAYLVRDVGRRHGALRVAGAGSVIRCTDEALLAEVVADRKLRRLGLELMAPTVAVAAVGDAEVLAALRTAGYLPMPWTGEPESATAASSGANHAEVAEVAEVVGAFGDIDELGDIDSRAFVPVSAAGVVDLTSRRMARDRSVARAQETPDEHTARIIERIVNSTMRQSRPAPPPPETEDPGAAAARLVGLAVSARRPASADPALVRELRRVNGVVSDDELELLAAAILAGDAIAIRYRSVSGSVTERVVSAMSYAGNLLEGFCHLRQDARTFLASDIEAVFHP